MYPCVICYGDIIFFLIPQKDLPSHSNQTQPPLVGRLAGTLATATAAAFAGFAEQIQQLSGRQHSVNLEGSK